MLLQDIIDISKKESEALKSVDYFGLTLQVPKETRFIATDKNGVIFFYSVMPETDTNNWVSDSEHSVGGFVLTNKHIIEDWKDSLLEL